MLDLFLLESIHCKNTSKKGFQLWIFITRPQYNISHSVKATCMPHRLPLMNGNPSLLVNKLCHGMGMCSKLIKKLHSLCLIWQHTANYTHLYLCLEWSHSWWIWKGWVLYLYLTCVIIPDFKCSLCYLQRWNKIFSACAWSLIFNQIKRLELVSP